MRNPALCICDKHGGRTLFHFYVTGSEEGLPELKLIDEAHLKPPSGRQHTFPKVLNRSVLFPHWRKQNALMCSPLMQAVCSHSGFRVLLRLNVPIKIFFSHVRTEPPLTWYYQYFAVEK